MALRASECSGTAVLPVLGSGPGPSVLLALGGANAEAASVAAAAAAAATTAQYELARFERLRSGPGPAG